MVLLPDTAEAACRPQDVKITYTGAQGDPDYAKIAAGCASVNVYIDNMKSGNVYLVRKKSGDLYVHAAYIRDKGSYAIIQLQFNNGYYRSFTSVATRYTNKSASSATVS